MNWKDSPAGIRKQILDMFHVTEEEIAALDDEAGFGEAHRIARGDREYFVQGLADITASMDFKMSATFLKEMERAAEETRRTLTITNEYHYSRWYRFVIAVLRAAYGWIPRYGYKGPPREYTTILPNMRVTSMVEDERGLHLEFRSDTQPVTNKEED